MPFKSKAQQGFMFAAESRGDLPAGTARRWAKDTPNIKSLPAHVSHKADGAAPTEMASGTAFPGRAYYGQTERVRKKEPPAMSAGRKYYGRT